MPHLSDCADLDRLGIRGTQLIRWLTANDYEVGDHANKAYAQRDGSLIARLSNSDLIWLGGEKVRKADLNPIEEDFGCYTVSRLDSHLWFKIAGDATPMMFARLCGVDLSDSEFANFSVAQTSIAKISAVVLRADAEKPTYHLLADNSYARYLWTAIVDAAGS